MSILATARLNYAWAEYMRGRRVNPEGRARGEALCLGRESLQDFDVHSLSLGLVPCPPATRPPNSMHDWERVLKLNSQRCWTDRRLISSAWVTCLLKFLLHSLSFTNIYLLLLDLNCLWWTDALSSPFAGDFARSGTVISRTVHRNCPRLRNRHAGKAPHQETTPECGHRRTNNYLTSRLE